VISLHVGGREFGGWTRARVTRSIESIAGSFELEVTDRWSGQSSSWPISEGDECSVSVNGTVVLTGYVDRRRLSYGPEEHSISVSGRDRTGDLVDSSALLGQWDFRNASVHTLASRVCDPHGIRVVLQSALNSAEIPPLSKLTIDPGDSGFDVIEKACRMAGLLPVSDGTGRLVLTRAGTGRAATPLVEGENILAASSEFDISGRFRRYVVLAQHHGSDEFSGTAAAHIHGSAQDATVERSARVLCVRAEGSSTRAYAKRRAEWEATVRAARGDSAVVTVQGWTQANGALWPVNSLVRVKSPRIEIDGDMLISQVTYSADSGGSTTELTLRRPDAFKPEPVVKKRQSSNLWKEISGGV
jgi:prophage tail gpP-like protein